jgi:segregation and condensation protein B
MEPPRQNAVEDPPGEELEPTPGAPGSDERARAEPGASGPLSDEELVRRIAALVFASPEPLSLGRLVELLDRPGEARVRAALEELGHRLAASGLPLEVREIAGGFLFLTAPEMGPTVALLAERRRNERLSGAALETLAIVAYRQPVTKSEIEAIRGVQAGPILRTLVDRGLVKVTGRADQPGHALEYGTTREFLDRFGLANLGDLPRDGELARD